MNASSRRALLTAIITGSVASLSGATAYSYQRNPHAEAIECMLNDDTVCAVEVWKNEFESDRFSDENRQTYFLTLLVHGLRSLDKGKPSDARDAYETALEILPSSDAVALAYLADATTAFRSLVALNNMDLNWNASPTVESEWEGDYVAHTGRTGAETTVFALTAKNPGWSTYFRTSTHGEPEVAYRFNFKPLSNTGYVVLFLGTRADSSPVFFDLGFYTNWRAAWSVYANVDGSSEPIHQGSDAAVDLEQWHSLEARLKRNTVELWLDYQYLATLSIPGLEFDTVGFGTGLHADSYSATFTALFDDEVIYTLK